MLAVAVLAGSAGAFGAAPVDAATPGLTVTVDCYSSRERTIVKNNKTSTVTLKTIGSLYKPYSNEPFSVARKLAAGKTVTFYTGSGASASVATTLTRRSIYNNEIRAEGARVTSSVGTFTKTC